MEYNGHVFFQPMVGQSNRRSSHVGEIEKYNIHQNQKISPEVERDRDIVYALIGTISYENGSVILISIYRHIFVCLLSSYVFISLSHSH